MTEASNAPGTSGWAVIAPDQKFWWVDIKQTGQVEQLVAGKHPGALDSRHIAPTQDGMLRAMTSDVALLFPEEYPPNPLATTVLAALSGGQLDQPWRGHVAITEYDRDPETGEVGFPGVLSRQAAALIQTAVRQAQGLQ